MDDRWVKYQIYINQAQASKGSKKLIERNGKKLEVMIPPGVRNRTKVRCQGALQITDGLSGDIYLVININNKYKKWIIPTIILCVFAGIYLYNSVINSNKQEVDAPISIPSSTHKIVEQTCPSGNICIDNTILVGGDYQPIKLINNKNAINPTFSELIAFIKADKTDKNKYQDNSYVCGDYAQDVHNNAEAAGIKAAWVAIEFSDDDEGHAVNAFETIDKGLVFIDSTGDRPNTYLNIKPNVKLLTSWDGIAYIEIGKELGKIIISDADDLSYKFYQNYHKQCQDFESLLEAYSLEVQDYNNTIKGQTFIIGSKEYNFVDAWEKSLEEEGQGIDELRKDLGCWFEPQGIVKSVDIFW